MVKLNKIYTKTGDDGTTGLVGGERISKASLRVAAYGAVDEANSAIGMASVHARGEHKVMLKRIQQDMFDLGADLSTLYKKGGSALRIVSAQVKRLEDEIDEMNAKLKPLTSFILPGGNDAGANLHMARAIVRRAERVAVALAEEEKVNPLAVEYLNRLSDHLFVLARVVNGSDEVLWEPGANR